jgi:D-alanine-D-alanine ligase
MRCRILILHSRVEKGAPPDELDTLVQAGEVRMALRSLGWTAWTRPFCFDFSPGSSRNVPDAVFNLVEPVAGCASLAYLAPAVLERAGLRYTGCSAGAQYVTTHKILAKQLMRWAGVPTPDWIMDHGGCRFTGGRWIVKPEGEDASIGLTADSVVTASSPDGIEAILRRKRRQTGLVHFAERYIAGRELAVSVLGGDGGPEALPPVEMVFASSAEPRINHYMTKWYAHFPGGRPAGSRRLDFPAGDRLLLEDLQRLALRCWHLFGLRGYARIDFRVDGQGRPWVIDVNANPGLSSGSSILLAAGRKGMDLAAVARRIVDAALRQGCCGAERARRRKASGDRPHFFRKMREK